MGIIDDYLNSSTDTSSASKSGGLIEQYLDNASPEPLPKDLKKVLIIKPPISGVSKEDSDAINAQPSQVGGVNPRSQDKFPLNPTELIPNIGSDIANNVIGGVKEVGSGLSNKSYKEAGLGALKLITSIPAGVSEGVGNATTQLTGNPDIGDRAGFLAGAAVPIVPGSGFLKLPTSATGVVQATNAARPSKSALKTLVESIGPENLASVVKDLKANPRLAPADLSPKVLQDTQNLFTTEGQHINYLANTSAERLAGSKGAATTALDASMGASVNAAKKVEDLKKAAQEIGKKNIEPVLAAKPHTDVTDLINHIDSEIGPISMRAIKKGEAPPLPLSDYQRELLNIRDKLRSRDWPDREKMLTYTDQLHDAQIKLREKAQGLTSGAATGSERNTGKDLLTFREKMKDAVGPEYKEALGKYAGQKKVEEAFHNGYDTILSNSKKLENDPSFFEKWVNSSSRKPGELEAAREGARLRIQHEIEGARTAATNPASKAIGIGQTDFSVKRIEALLGKEEAGKLLKTLDDERKIANTHNKIIEGSQTAMRTASKEAFTKPTATDVMRSAPAVAAMEASNYFMGGTAGAGAALLAGAKIGGKAKDIIAQKLFNEHNAAYSKLALPTEGPSRDALIQSLEAAIPKPKLSVRSKLRLSNLVSNP